VRFTLRQIEYYVRTCEAGSVTEAALGIPVTQSSVSAAIAQLERAVGVPLLIRHHAQGVSPTPAGQRFLEHARALLDEAARLEAFANELTEDLSGPLALGCLVTLAPLVAPRLCHEFAERHPAVDISVVEGGQDDLLAGLRAGELSVAVTYDLMLEEDIAFEPLVALPPYAVLAEGHPLAGRDELSLEQLASEELVLLDLPHSRDYFRALFSERGLDPRVGHRSGQPEVIRTMVANGYGYTIVNARPRTDLALDGRRLATVPLAGDPRAMLLGVATLAEGRPTRVVASFVAHCRALITETSVPGLEVGPHARTAS
jgi:DNA-binding transcriptional LysR family regulator